MKFSGKVGNGGDPDHRLDIGILFRIRHYWEIRKVISTDCAARRCSAGHTRAGIAIATMTSLRHRPTRDSGTDIAKLVRHALAEVCVVPVFINSISLGFVAYFPRFVGFNRSSLQIGHFISPERFEKVSVAHWNTLTITA